MTSEDTGKLLKIPALGSNPICPVMAIRNLLSITLGPKMHPCFNIRLHRVGLP